MVDDNIIQIIGYQIKKGIKMECCKLDIEELYKEEDEYVCESCYDRIEGHIEDLMLIQAKEDFYERNKKYDTD